MVTVKQSIANALGRAEFQVKGVGSVRRRIQREAHLEKARQAETKSAGFRAGWSRALQKGADVVGSGWHVGGYLPSCVSTQGRERWLAWGWLDREGAGLVQLQTTTALRWRSCF